MMKPIEEWDFKVGDLPIAYEDLPDEIKKMASIYQMACQDEFSAEYHLIRAKAAKELVMQELQKQLELTYLKDSKHG